MYFDFDGNKIDQESWSTMFHSGGKSIVRDVLEDEEILVSTVWIGLSWGEEQPPLIYETMAFPAESWTELGCWRWATREEAVEGHRGIVEDMKNKK